METLLTRIKSTLQNDSTLSYVKKVEIVTPRTLPDISKSLVPWIGIAPVNSPESWYSTAQKKVIHTVEIYCVQYIQIQEVAIIGNASFKGITDFIANVESATRGEHFASAGTNYLSRPTDITGVEYATAGWGDRIFLIVGVVTLTCEKLFSV